MRKVILVLLIVALLIPAISFAWDRSGHSRGHHDCYNDSFGRNFERAFAHELGRAGVDIIRGIVNVPYSYYNAPYYYNRPRYYDYGCTQEVRYGHWERDSYGRDYWVTTRVEYEPCRRW